jgi:glyceraldehyde 3-phosphate dehydrogenase
VFRTAAASGPLKGVMGVLEEEYASARILGEPLSSVVDLPLVQVLDGTLLSIAAWYDNEMGYATRLAEMAKRIAG